MKQPFTLGCYSVNKIVKFNRSFLKKIKKAVDY
ncbi:hypothetical protein AsAng_0057060 [Aureispira anguillae]|uniref:Uncharacterized protein n=1 Tax=Aureispira anguillae TaxID=2864201 RepID=A0A915YKK2_9BACT|nr:hypothetical protein AsAng_0057060 [Aureispira anguillae]